MKTELILLSICAQLVFSLDCQNGGITNNNKCQCFSGYFGDSCQYLNCNGEDPAQCLNFNIDFCSIPPIKDYCPKLCKKCDDNKNSLPDRKALLAETGRNVIVHLFEWKWTDIANECEKYLGPNGYAGVQISPPNEHALVKEPFRPWWQRYQPVSYKLRSRSGNEEEFKDMVNRCNKAGVRIYVDSVINHMSSTGGQGSAGSDCDPAKREYPGVPYGPDDFNDKNCKSSTGGIESYNDIDQVRNCNLVGLPDLNIGSENVRQKIADYMNHLIDLGVAGFRIDASKHMWPNDLIGVYSKLKNPIDEINGENKPAFIFHEVIDLGKEPIKNTDYTLMGRVTEFKYGMNLSQIVLKRNSAKLADLKNFGEKSGLIPEGDSVVFIDNHDNQRGHGAGGEILTYKNSRQYKIANSFMLAWPYGIVKIMSSYDFPRDNDALGPPSDFDGLTKDVTYYDDGSCGNGWICEHRWKQITNMVKFRQVAENTKVDNWWDNGKNQIAFSRGDKAFIVINNEDYGIYVKLKTGLKEGKYCDVISGEKEGSICTGKTISVNGDGEAEIYIPSFSDNPVIAIHAESKIL